MINQESFSRKMWVGIAVLLGCAAVMAQVETRIEQLGEQRPITSQVAAAAPNPAPQAATPAALGFSERNPRYRLRSGDVLELTFAFLPEFNQIVPVQPDGFVTMRQIGDMHVAGLALPELRTMLVTRYSAILNAPEIGVQLREFEKPYFVADGKVGHPGKYELRGETTVAEGIAIAGGMNEESKHSQVVLFRRVNDQWFETKVIDLKKMMKDKNLSEDIALRPGDLIFVPQNRLSKIRRYIPSPGLGMALTP
jgi:polysaccharide biosynthesis/export protein